MFRGHQRTVTNKRERHRTLFKTLVQKPRYKNWGSGWGQLPEIREISNKTWDLNSSKWDSKLSPRTWRASGFLSVRRRELQSPEVQLDPTHPVASKWWIFPKTLYRGGKRARNGLWWTGRGCWVEQRSLAYPWHLPMMPCCSRCQGIGRCLRGGSEGGALSWQIKSQAQSQFEAQGVYSSPLSLRQRQAPSPRGFISMLMRLRRWAQLFSSKNSISPFLALWAYLSDLDTLCLIKAVFVFSFFYSFYFMPNPLPLPLLEQTVSSGCPLPPTPRGNLWRQARWGFFFLCFTMGIEGKFCIGNLW